MIESLPPRPLRRNEVTALESSDAVELSKQLAELQVEEENEVVIGVYLAVGETIHLLGYTPESEWTLITSLTNTAGTGIMEDAVDQFIEWLDANYDQDDVTITVEDYGAETGLLNLLPNRPAGKEEILQLDEHPTLDVIPLFALQETHEIVCVTGVTVSLEEGLTAVTVGYLPETGWEVIHAETAESHELPEPNMEKTTEWIDEHYEDKVLAIDNRNQL